MSDLAVPRAAVRHLGLSLPLIVLLLVFASVLGAGAALLGDPDTYWHIATGRWIIAHGAVPHADLFSHSMPGAPWVAHEWLAEVALAELYDLFGWGGLVVATALSLGLALALMTRCLLRFLEPAHALLGMATAWGVSLPHLLARPHILALPLMVLWFAGLIEARAKDRAPSLLLLPAMALWANLHGGFLLGLVFAGFFGLEAVAEATNMAARLAAARRWGVFGVAALLAGLVTPNGVAGLLLPLHLMHMEFALSVLDEWRSPNFQLLQPIEIWLMLALLAALGLGFRLRLPRLLMLLFLLHQALQHQRHGELLGLLTPLLVAAPLAAQLRARLAPAAPSALDLRLAALARPARPLGLALAALVVAALAAAALSRPLERPADPFAPSAALAAVEAAQVPGPVLNDYGFGGYLIFRGIAPFIDGRTDMYGDAFLKRYLEALRGVSDGLPQLLADYHITWTLLQADTPGVVLMDHLPGWRRLYADDTAVVHVRAALSP